MPQPRQSNLPPIPDETLQEGSRWRFHRPSPEQVAAWFANVPLDEGMEHEHYVGGVVIIPQNEKVKYQTPGGTTERYEMTYTPYVQIGTRVGYMRRLAELRGWYWQSVPAKVPRGETPASPYFNGHMPDGLWWHVVASTNERGEAGHTRFLCATHVVRVFEPETVKVALSSGKPLDQMPPLFEAFGTKQVGGAADVNAVMKAQTGAAGRALGAAGILVVGTGIASAEDMTEYAGGADGVAPTLPETASVPSEAPEGPLPDVPEEDPLVALRTQALGLQEQMQSTYPAAWTTFAAWWKERATTEGWSSLDDVPVDALRGVVQRMTTLRDGAVQANDATPVAS